MLVNVHNPLLKELVKVDLHSINPLIETLFMENLVQVATNGNDAKSDKFIKYDPTKFVAKGGTKSLGQTIPPELDSATINKAFEGAINYPAS